MPSLEDRLRVVGAEISLELIEDLRRAGPEGVAVIDRAIERARRRPFLAKVLELARKVVTGEPVPDDAVGIFSPRQFSAFDVLRDRADEWLFEPRAAFASRFEAAFQSLADFALADRRAEEDIRRNFPKVGRNDPCPCLSGKKYKKCCGAPRFSRGPGLGALADLLENVVVAPEFYALTFDDMMSALGGDEAVKHLYLLAQRDRPRSLPEEPFELLAYVVRECGRYMPLPRWLADIALMIIEGKPHTAIDRGEVATWLLEHADEAGVRDRVHAALRRPDDLTVKGAIAAADMVLDDDPELALEIALGKSAAVDPRLALLRALAVRESGENEAARAELKAAGTGVTPGSDLAVAVDEAMSALDDPPPKGLDEAALERLASGPSPLATWLLREADVMGAERPKKADRVVPGARPPETAAAVAPPAPATPTPTTRPTHVDRSLGQSLAGAIAARRERVGAAEAEFRVAEAELEAARSEVIELEQRLDAAQSRLARAKKTFVQKEAAHRMMAAEAREDLVPVTRALEAGNRELTACLAGTGAASAVAHAIPVVAAITDKVLAIVLPLSRPVLGTGIAEGHVELVLATVAGLAEASETGAKVSAAEVLGFHALMVEETQADADLIAAALDQAWLCLPRVRDAGLALRVLPISGEAAVKVIAAAAAIDTAMLATTAAASGDDLTLPDAAGRLGISLVDLVRELGARGLWDGPTVPLATFEMLAQALGATGEIAVEKEDEDPDEATGRADPLDADPHEARRRLRASLRRLLRHGKIGAAHTRLDNVLRGAAGDVRGSMKDAALALLACGVFRRKPTLNGLHISIEPKRVPEVQRFVETGEVPWPRVGECLGIERAS
jgi:hypothetical protein